MKKWFFDQFGHVINLNSFFSFTIEIKEIEYRVYGIPITDVNKVLLIASFQTEKEARDYLAEIYNFLIAE